MNLQQIETRNIPIPARRLDLARAGGTGGGPDFVGREQTPRLAQFFQAVADDFLRRAVHRRRVDQATPCIEKIAHDFRTGFASDTVVAHVERDPAPQPDHGQDFASGQDRSRQQDRRLRRGHAAKHGACPGCRQRLKQATAARL